jgi:hypothetical protein
MPDIGDRGLELVGVSVDTDAADDSIRDFMKRVQDVVSTLNP